MFADFVYPEARPTCSRCKRALITCYCDQLRAFESEPQWILLIHPKEERNRVGTARIAHLSLQGSALLTGNGESFDSNPRFLKLIQDPELFPVVLYPGSQAVALDQLTPNSFKTFLPEGRQLAVIVIDGTWAMAKKMIRTSKTLKSLPQIAFTPEHLSNYRIRKQPAPLCVSTVEAVHQVLESLAKLEYVKLPEDRRHTVMLDVFDAMVCTQERYVAASLQ